jgi:hypothetical protein
VDPAVFPSAAPPVPVAPPVPPVPPAPRRALSPRFQLLIRHPKRCAALLAVLIGFASVLSAVIAWQASLASIDAGRYQSLAVQQQARRELIERELEGTVQQDQRFVAQYQEHALAAQKLQDQADSLRSTDVQAADVLDVQAQSELAQARSLVPFFVGASGIYLDANGTVPYDKDFVLRSLQDGNLELRDLRTSNVEDLATAADARSVQLVAVAAVIVTALFFLTIAQVSRTLIRTRQAFFVAGGLLVVVGTLLFLLIEIVA